VTEGVETISPGSFNHNSEKNVETYFSGHLLNAPKQFKDVHTNKTVPNFFWVVMEKLIPGEVV